MSAELIIEDLRLGEGKTCAKGALITTQYRGWLESGEEFDSAYARGKPFQCVIGSRRVIHAVGNLFVNDNTGSPRPEH